jgi:hypothetical protein
MLIKFGCVTLAAPPVAGLEHLVGLNGSVGVLLGVPFVGTQLEHQAVLAPEPHDPEDAVWLLPLKLLTPDEYAWVMEDEDGGRAKLLAQHFLGHDRHSSWPTRPSALPLDETA